MKSIRFVSKKDSSNRPVVPMSSGNSASYTFTKSQRKSVFTEYGSLNEERFGFNPREAHPDPYDLTHIR